MSTITETWWIITTRSGLALTLPAPLRRTGKPIPPGEADLTGWMESTSQITGRSYALDMREALSITTDTRTDDPDRYQRSLAKALGLTLSDGSSSSGPEAESWSDDPTSPGGPSTGGRTKKITRH